MSTLVIDLPSSYAGCLSCHWIMPLDVFGLPRACPVCLSPFERTRINFADGRAVQVRRPNSRAA